MAFHHSAFCACCAPAAPSTPIEILNRPGLSHITYRVGTFATFREAMLEQISRHAALSGLTTRESNDYAITLMELFAASGDVLTFYSERIANELYLRTARERDSLLHVTNLIGYRLRSGLAAQTFLNFTLDAGAATKLRKGLKVMSVPGQDERPQFFETLELVDAHADINDVPAFAPPGYFNGFATGQNSGPLTSRPAKLAVGDGLIVFGYGILEEKTVEALANRVDAEVLTLTPAMQFSGWYQDTARIVKLEGRYRFFGHNAPKQVNVYKPPTTPTGWPSVVLTPVDASLATTVTALPIDARVNGIATGTQLLIDAGAGSFPRLRTATVTKIEEKQANLSALDQLTETVTHLHVRQTIRGRPVAIALPTTIAKVFARSGAGDVLALQAPVPPSAPRPWTTHDLDGVSSDVTGVASSAARLDIFVRNRYLSLQQRIFSSGVWGGWINHGGLLTTEPRPVVDAFGKIQTFVRGLDFALWHLDATSGSPGVWQPLGGVIASAAAPVATGSANLAVFVRGIDRGLWYRQFVGGVWSDWLALKGILGSGPAAAANSLGHIDVCALDDRGALQHRYFDGTQWSGWRDLSGEMEGEVSIVASFPDRAELFAKGKDGQLWTIARVGTHWGDWVALGGKLTSSPTAIQDVSGLHVHVRGNDGSIAHRALSAGGWSNWQNFGQGIGAIPDRRNSAIYHISDSDIVFRDYDYPTSVAQGRVALRATGNLNGFAKLKKGRRILLRSENAIHVANVQATTPFSAIPGDLVDHIHVDFTPALPKPYKSLRLNGNVASASHGETQPIEALGHGDGAKQFQKFKLGRPNLTYLLSNSDIAGAAELEVRVGGELWSEVPSFHGRKSTERIYTARQNDSAETYITFGDGKTGARAQSGAMNIAAKYRQGLGLEGFMKPDQVSLPLERPPGLRAVSNPLVADGAAAPETRDAARYAAPNSVRTFNRAVSLQDFEAIATASGLASRAFVTWVWHELQRAVHVSVIGPDGLKLSQAAMARLQASIEASRDINHPMFLANIVRVPIVVSAKLLRNPKFEADSVLAAAREKLLGLFAFDRVMPGEAVFASTVYAALQSAEGVLAVDVDVFNLKGYADLTATELAIRAVDGDSLQPHVRIYPARPTPPLGQIDRFARAGFEGSPPPVLAAEQVFIEMPESDVALNVVEAL